MIGKTGIALVTGCQITLTIPYITIQAITGGTGGDYYSGDYNSPQAIFV